MKIVKIFILILSFIMFASTQINAGGNNLNIPETDTGDFQLVGFFDLRDRESFIQLTNTEVGPADRNVHIQIFNVGNDCIENNFFDVYTPNDTHVYNLRDITTNDGNPSGVVLPNDAYGIFVATYDGDDSDFLTLIGNLRIDDNNGYEYRTNLQGIGAQSVLLNPDDTVNTFNFNTISGVTLSDIVGISLSNTASTLPSEVMAADVSNIWNSIDVDIFNLNEVPFSCRNIIFSCVDQDNPRLEELLENAGDANVASFDYGINNAIPHSKGGELLCPGNVIDNGFARLALLNRGESTDEILVIFIGLNNGNGRGSMDAAWLRNSMSFSGGSG